jgi:capsular exopolysaccharide synthesis family protein
MARTLQSMQDLPTLSRKGINPNLIAHYDPKSPISEQYRMLRSNIQFSSIDHEVKVIMVTSAGPGEGKTTTSVNLAITYAQADRNVLLIDADMRKPNVHKNFLVSNLKGLSTVISGQSQWENTVIPTFIPNLSLLTSGPVAPNPSEMLGSHRMKRIIEDAKQTYDIVIIDTPPTLAVTDAQIVATNCDGVIIVTEHGRVKREYSKKVKAILEYVQAKILGVVINNIPKKAAESYNYYAYYSYYGESTKSKSK